MDGRRDGLYLQLTKPAQGGPGPLPIVPDKKPGPAWWWKGLGKVVGTLLWLYLGPTGPGRSLPTLPSPLSRSPFNSFLAFGRLESSAVFRIASA